MSRSSGDPGDVSDVLHGTLPQQLDDGILAAIVADRARKLGKALYFKDWPESAAREEMQDAALQVCGLFIQEGVMPGLSIPEIANVNVVLKPQMMVCARHHSDIGSNRVQVAASGKPLMSYCNDRCIVMLIASTYGFKFDIIARSTGILEGKIAIPVGDYASLEPADADERQLMSIRGAVGYSVTPEEKARFISEQNQAVINQGTEGSRTFPVGHLPERKTPRHLLN